jgi:hypothetical protein
MREKSLNEIGAGLLVNISQGMTYPHTDLKPNACEGALPAPRDGSRINSYRTHKA